MLFSYANKCYFGITTISEDKKVTPLLATLNSMRKFTVQFIPFLPIFGYFGR